MAEGIDDLDRVVSTHYCPSPANRAHYQTYDINKECPDFANLDCISRVSQMNDHIRGSNDWMDKCDRGAQEVIIATPSCILGQFLKVHSIRFQTQSCQD